jgi:DNA-binding CsgD family transcriptional regulator
VAGAKGDFDEAMPEFEAALALQGASTVPFDRARTLLAAGRVHRRARQWGAARQSLTEALSCFDELGAPLWSGQARAELARIGGRPPSSLELSVSERRVADLAASGRTNKEVADELFMAVKTVEWHLGRVYRKLGIRNRAELSASLTATKEID